MISGERITLRAAENRDMELLRNWRNHPKMKKNLFFHTPISKIQQARWYERSVVDTCNQILMVEDPTSQKVGAGTMLVYDDLQPVEEIKIYDKRAQVPSHYDTFAEFHYSYRYGEVYSPYVKQLEPLQIESRHFSDCITTGSKPDSSAYEAMQMIQILERTSKSLEFNGGRDVVSGTVRARVRLAHCILLNQA